MRLLITTQAIDQDDPILGFFHGWVREFASRFDSIEVICLRQGKTELPSNVRVHSLGKESGESRIKYLMRFCRYLSELSGTYDVVFSHMNPHYIVLAGWYWKLKKIPMLFWRNHARMNVLTRIAAWYARTIFYTSPFACTRIFKHSVQMPVGIDTKLFSNMDVLRDKRKILALGRLSPVKKLESFIDASKTLTSYTFVVYGDAPASDNTYATGLKKRAEGHIQFYPSVKNYETPKIYTGCGVYVNLTPEGSMDKTILEAMACDALVLVANRSFAGVLPEICLLKDVSETSVIQGIKEFEALSDEEIAALQKKLRSIVEEKHSLALLADTLMRFAVE